MCYANFLIMTERESVIMSTLVCLYFREEGKDQKGISRHKTPSLIGPLAQPKFVEWLEGGEGLLLRMVAR